MAQNPVSGPNKKLINIFAHKYDHVVMKIFHNKILELNSTTGKDNESKKAHAA